MAKVEEGLTTLTNGWSQNADTVSGRVKRESICTASDAGEVAESGGGDLSPDEGYTELSPTVQFNRRSTSIGSTNTISDAVSMDSDSNSSTDVKNELYQFSPTLHSRPSNGTRNIEPLLRTTSIGSAPSSVDATVGADTNVLSPDEANRARVWSGGYCCEVKNNGYGEKPTSNNGKDVLADEWLSLKKLMREECLNSPPSSYSNGRYADSAFTPDFTHETELQQRRCSYTTSRSNGMSVVIPQADQSASLSPILRDPSSPGVRWRTNSDRDSPYVSVMALASSCQLFSEACRSPLIEGVTQDAPEESVSSDCTEVKNEMRMLGYWLHSDLPDENILFTEKHCELINRITAAYNRFVQTGTTINQTLTNELAVIRLACFCHHKANK